MSTLNTAPMDSDTKSAKCRVWEASWLSCKVWKEGQREPVAAGPGAVPDSLMLVPGPPGIKSFMQCLEGGSS